MSFIGVLLVPYLHEEEADGGPEEFADSAEDGDEEAHLVGHSHLGGGHGKSAFTASELEGEEEEEIGEKTGEGEDEEGVEEGERCGR